MFRTYKKKDLCEEATATERGFTPGRTCIIRIIALRLLAQRRYEYRQPLYAAYINPRAAFDLLVEPFHFLFNHSATD